VLPAYGRRPRYDRTATIGTMKRPTTVGSRSNSRGQNQAVPQKKTDPTIDVWLQRSERP